MSAIRPYVLDKLRSLKPNWNGYGEKAIDERAIDTLNWISLAPLAHGGVQLEWHTTSFDIEIEVRPDGTLRAGLWESQPEAEQ